MNNEGFTIKCNKCGKVIQVANRKHKKFKWREPVSNIKGICYKLTTWDEDPYMKCECGNTLIL